MSTDHRFTLDDRRYVIDTLNPTNSGKGYCHEGCPEDDVYLRGRVVMVRLSEILEKLIHRREPKERDWQGRKYRPFNEEHAVWVAILETIKASHLNTFDPQLAVRHPFLGALKRKKAGMQDFTSLSLFTDDVERLLRDMYGDFESEALERLIQAVFSIGEKFTRYVRPDIYKEHRNAMAFDYSCGIGVPEGCGISGSEWRAGMRAASELRAHVIDVTTDAARFPHYTHDFIRSLDQHWPWFSRVGSPEMDEFWEGDHSAGFVTNENGNA
jgi:hypothetical protein